MDVSGEGRIRDRRGSQFSNTGCFPRQWDGRKEEGRKEIFFPQARGQTGRTLYTHTAGRSSLIIIILPGRGGGGIIDGKQASKQARTKETQRGEEKDLEIP